MGRDAAQRRKDYRLIPVARDGIAVIVHPRNPITNVTALQLRALFGGEVLDWAALGGIEGEPAIVSREDGSGTRGAFEARVMGDQRVTLNALVMPTTAGGRRLCRLAPARGRLCLVRRRVDDTCAGRAGGGAAARRGRRPQRRVPPGAHALPAPPEPTLAGSAQVFSTLWTAPAGQKIIEERPTRLIP